MDQPRISKKAQRRLAQKAEKEQERKARVAAQPAGSALPRIGNASPLLAGVPRVAEDPASYLDQPLTYTTEGWDCDGSWSWGQARADLQREWASIIQPALDAHRQETWRHICSLVVNGANRLLPRHHHQDVSSIVREAQSRWVDLCLHDHPTAFRFRFGAKRRLWGYRLGSVFHILWWDSHHKIYPVKER